MTYKKIQQHEKCLSTLRCIERAEHLINFHKEEIEPFAVFSIEATKKLEHNIDIYQQAIKRLKLRYEKQMRELIGIRVDE